MYTIFFIFKVACIVYSRVPIFGGRGEAIVPCSGMREGKESIQWFLEVPISGRWEGRGCVPPGNAFPILCKIKFETIFTYSVHL